MSYKDLEGVVIHGDKGIAYRLFKFLYVTDDEYQLAVFSGENMRSGANVIIIPFDSNDQKKIENRLQFFANTKGLNWVGSATRGGTNFVVFDLSPSEFERAYMHLAPVQTSEPDKPDLTREEDSDPKPEDSPESPKQSGHKIILLVFLCLVVGVSGLYSIRYFSSPAAKVTQTPVATVIPPTNTPIVTDTPKLTITPLPTDTSVPTNTEILELSLTLTKAPNVTSTPTLPPSKTPTFTRTPTPSKTPTITPIPTRTGIPGEVNLCFNLSMLNVRSGPSGDSSVIGSLSKGDCLWYKTQFKNNGIIWVEIAPEQKFKGWVSSQFLAGDLSALPIATMTPTPITTSTP